MDLIVVFVSLIALVDYMLMVLKIRNYDAGCKIHEKVQENVKENNADKNYAFLLKNCTDWKIFAKIYNKRLMSIYELFKLKTRTNSIRT